MPSTEPSLQQQVGRAIRHSPYFSAKRVRFETVDDQVILEGVVSTYFQKQMAQETVLRIDGIRQIENRIQVI
jgi:osmotically-inducible protein OsmY